ncbi:P-loop containing nucleoside triphosphate hydrolase protein [Lobosporangium transversale]|uniref:p-loop containing nucleoside triphosphate hydrolase protein n=1 Tax=Lobosporangium transversale TaxID=64571 RepID=A0A1Y2H0W5_9FUNG|nr:P-loop containing nucleoside triphosphate hydrolase protein [Lobosporangium transversale]ORZ28166.1 P-loop containing nucleoside triphosphate hydrolase protein [Lobosporangium transversale]|eukprot:XP_021885851.1 P-loop containing nucleoside triphosphate hydrolase protein [Lobosporangium transversale]
MSKNTAKKGKGVDSSSAKGPAKGGNASGAKSSGSLNNKGGKGVPQDEPAAPQISKAVFPGWTGKTPSSLLHEHCQKLGWEKPNFDVTRNSRGFVATVILGKRNKKTGQIETATFTPQDIYKPTAVEARHYGATYALHRVNSHKNLMMVLPPGPRDLWSQLDAEKAKAGPSEQHLYLPDPFISQTAKLQLQQQQIQQALQEQARIRAATPVKDTSQETAVNYGPSEYASRSSLTGQADDEKQKKAWDKLPMVHMNQEMRAEVEDVIKKQMAGELYQTYIEEYGTHGEPLYNTTLSKALTRMGFRDRHIAEAMQYCNDQASALDWLCLHVPEDDLPPSFLQSNYNPTITTSSHTSVSLGREYAIKRLSAIGFTSAICGQVYDMVGGDEDKAMDELFKRLAFPKGQIPEDMVQDIPMEPESPEQLRELREDEMLALESIYDDRFTRDGDSCAKIKLETTLHSTKNAPKIELEIRIPGSSTYPFNQPPLFIINESDLPSYLRLSIIQKTMQYAYRAMVQAMGGPIVYDVVEWVQDNLKDILDNPPSLVQLTEGLIKIDLTQDTENQEPLAALNDGSVAEPLLIKPTNMKPSPNSLPTQKDNKRAIRRLNIKPNSPGSLTMLKEYEQRMSKDISFQALQIARAKLPAWGFKDQLVKAVKDNSVVIVCGETGCGKTTQVPQFILDNWIQESIGEYANIVCTQPRRIAAIGVAERVAVERSTDIGQQVGYSIRGENRSSKNTKLLFCTTGILLRRLHSDPTLQNVTHVMVDEVHERSVDSDFLLIILRDLIRKRNDLKLILMSATINSEFFSGYFDGCPVIEIPGFTHPVEELYMEEIVARTRHTPDFRGTTVKRTKMTEAMEEEWEKTKAEYESEGFDAETIAKVKTMEAYAERIDYELITASVADILKRKEPEGSIDGAILIFLPGVMEIKKCIDALTLFSRTVTQTLDIIPLHAALTPKEQSSVFAPVRKGVRKIVVATNVAETSITIDGVVYVIDSGRVKETRMENNMTKLVETWTSFASTRQRKGRAGRTRPGIVYKLFSRKQSLKLAPQQDPEILRIPLEQLCLSVKAMGEKDVEAFLGKALTPPSLSAIQTALKALEDLGALDSVTGELTPLGRHMADIPADLRIAKMLIFGAVFRCLEPILIVASCMSVKSPFVSPMDKRDEAQNKKMQFATAKSDLLTAWKAYDTWEKMKDNGASRSELKAFCEDNFLSTNTLFEIQNLKSQYLEVLDDIGFTTKNPSQPQNRRRSERCSCGEDNVHSDNMALIKAIILSGLYPNVIKIKMPDAKFDKMIAGAVERQTVTKEIRMFTKDDGRVFLHPSSILFQTNQYQVPFLVYFSKLETTKVFVHDATMVPMYGLLLFGGQVQVDHLGRGLEIGDGFVKLRAFARIGVLVNQLKKLLDAILQAKVLNPDLKVSDNPVVETMIKLVTTDGI